jgi:hypothetical protein
MSGSLPLIVGDWIFDDTVKPFIAMAAFYAHCTLDDDDWTAVEQGVQASDEDKGNWYYFYLEGTEPLYLELARSPGSRVVLVRARGNEALARELQVLIDVGQTYRLSSREHVAEDAG